MRWFPLLAVALLLGACSGLSSKNPLFTPADAAGAPVLRDGLWLVEVKGCCVNTRRPVQKWPDCAIWEVVRGPQMLDFESGEDGAPGAWSQSSFLMAAGDPRILQFKYQDSIDPTTGGMLDEGYGYSALVATAHDTEGRIIAYRQWRVLCGPPTPKDEPEQLFPGVTKEGSDCLADLAETVRQAAVASEPFEDAMTFRWIRDTLP